MCQTLRDPVSPGSYPFLWLVTLIRLKFVDHLFFFVYAIIRLYYSGEIWYGNKNSEFNLFRPRHCVVLLQILIRWLFSNLCFRHCRRPLMIRWVPWTFRSSSISLLGKVLKTTPIRCSRSLRTTWWSVLNWKSNSKSIPKSGISIGGFIDSIDWLIASLTCWLLVDFVFSVDRESIVGCLFHLAKLRPQFLPRILTAIEFVHGNVPESYSKLEVEGLRKYLKVT